MQDATVQRSRGKAFDRIAVDYDRHRPTYPEQLVDLACDLGGLSGGAEVLEIGCGSGQLTGSLLARRLRVTAIEPGARFAKLAGQRLGGLGELSIVSADFEEARLPHGRFQAVFSASAIHWVDPDVGWRRIADALQPGGMLALVQYFGLNDPASADDQQALLGAIATIAPDVAADWPRYRDLDGTVAGVRERRENISEVWSWLSGRELARAYVTDLFERVEIAALPTLMEHTAAKLNDLMGTMSFWSRLSPRQHEAIANANRELQEQLGRPIRSSTVACLVTARRKAPDATC